MHSSYLVTSESIVSKNSRDEIFQFSRRNPSIEGVSEFLSNNFIDKLYGSDKFRLAIPFILSGYLFQKFMVISKNIIVHSPEGEIADFLEIIQNDYKNVSINE